MTNRLSNAFFGDKKLTQSVYNQIIQSSPNGKPHRFTQDQVLSIFKPYSDKLQTINSQSDSNITLLQIFTQFLTQVQQKFIKWQFKKFTSVIEISAHVFQHSFQHWLTKQQSFKYFSQVIVRHSLFRPPHSVCIFIYEEMRQITEFWIQHFYRFYQEYEQCFKSNLEETLATITMPLKLDKQRDLKQGKAISKETFLKFIEN